MSSPKMEKGKESSEQVKQTPEQKKESLKTEGQLNNFKKGVEEEKESSNTKGQLNNFKKGVEEKENKTEKKDKHKRKYRKWKKKYRKWKKKYEETLKERGVSLTKEDRENITKNHDKKNLNVFMNEMNKFMNEMNKAIKNNKVDKFLKKWKNKGYDDLLAKLSKNMDSKNSKKSSHKEKSKSKESNKKSSGTTSNSTESNKKSSGTTAEVGELVKVPESKEARMKWLFPSGTPKSKEEMEKYLTKIEIPVRTPNGTEDKLKLNIHVKLAEEIKAIFKEMYDKNIPVNTKKTGAYCWRKVRRGNSMSQHSYGSAIDVNYDVNGGVYGKTDKSSPYFNGKETVDIWKKHGFFRGGDWSAKSNDPMHFGFYNG